jgi:hypothetical protein
MSDQCRACGIPLLWALSPNGKACPLVPDPSDDGNVLVLAPRGLSKPLAVVLSGELLQEARDAGVKLRLNHFANCPKRERFRRPAVPA